MCIKNNTIQIRIKNKSNKKTKSNIVELNEYQEQHNKNKNKNKSNITTKSNIVQLNVYQEQHNTKKNKKQK